MILARAPAFAALTTGQSHRDDWAPAPATKIFWRSSASASLSALDPSSLIQDDLLAFDVSSGGASLGLLSIGSDW